MRHIFLSKQNVGCSIEKSDSEIAKDENSFNKTLRGKYSTNRIF